MQSLLTRKSARFLFHPEVLTVRFTELAEDFFVHLHQASLSVCVCGQPPPRFCLELTVRWADLFVIVPAKTERFPRRHH
jgi:hypothetical protein